MYDVSTTCFCIDTIRLHAFYTRCSLQTRYKRYKLNVNTLYAEERKIISTIPTVARVPLSSPPHPSLLTKASPAARSSAHDDAHTSH